ncbi:MAG: glycosyltransferase, partial [Panacibacter sp.]
MRILYGEKEPDEKEASYLINNSEAIFFKKIPSLRKSINLVHDIQAYRSLCHEIKKTNCDIVHTHGSKSGFLGRLAAYKNKVPCIVHTFHGHLFHSYYNSFISSFIIRFERWMARLTTTIIAISERQGKELVDIYKIVPPEKLSVIHLGIDKAQFNEGSISEACKIKTKYQFEPGTVTIGIIGRMVSIKNFRLFVEIAAN